MPMEIQTEHRYYCGVHSGASPWYDTREEAVVFAHAHRAAHHGGLSPDGERFETREVEVEIEEESEYATTSGGDGLTFPPGLIIAGVILVLLVTQCGK